MVKKALDEPTPAPESYAPNLPSAFSSVGDCIKEHVLLIKKEHPEWSLEQIMLMAQTECGQKITVIPNDYL